MRLIYGIAVHRSKAVIFGRCQTRRLLAGKNGAVFDYNGDDNRVKATTGGVTIHHFVIILLAGFFSGAHSSIFKAAPILVVWENREWRTWFHRSPRPLSV
jgi:hypothetical protein